MATEPTTSGAGQATDPATQTDAENVQSSDGTQNTAQEQQAKTFTQDDVDKTISARLRREQQKYDEKLAEVTKRAEEASQIAKQYQEKEEAAKRESEEKEKEKLLQKGEFEKARELEKRQHEEQLKREVDTRLKLEAELTAIRKTHEETQVEYQLTRLLDTASSDPDAAGALVRKEYQIDLDPKTHTLVFNGDPSLTPQDVVKTFLARHPVLARSEFAGTSGSGAAAQKGSTAGKRTFTLDQLADSSFMKEHAKEIDQAYREGRITS